MTLSQKILGVVLGLIVGLYIIWPDSKSPAQVTQDWELPVYTPNEVKDAYESNTVSADAKFKDVEVLLKARVFDINTDLMGDPYLVLSTGEEYDFQKPQAKFNQEDGAVLGDISKGQKIVIRCTGAGDVAKKPMFDDCKMVSTEGVVPKRPAGSNVTGSMSKTSCSDSEVEKLTLENLMQNDSVKGKGVEFEKITDAISIDLNKSANVRACKGYAIADNGTSSHIYYIAGRNLDDGTLVAMIAAGDPTLYEVKKLESSFSDFFKDNVLVACSLSPIIIDIYSVLGDKNKTAFWDKKHKEKCLAT